MAGEPTWWDWVSFFLGMGLAVYAFALLIADRIPFLAGLGQATKRASWWFVDVAGDWVIRWIYWPLWLAIRRLALLLWELPGLLWAGPREEAPPAPVSRVSVRLPADYVTLDPEGALHDAPYFPSVVRPSAPSAPEPPLEPAVPPAVERIMLDRSREGLIGALVAAGWSKTQIREHLRGANDAIGREVDVAVARLEQQPRETPLAKRALAPGVSFEREPAP